MTKSIDKITAWAHVKDALHAYAKSPSRTTEIKVEEAVAEVRHSADCAKCSSQSKEAET